MNRCGQFGDRETLRWYRQKRFWVAFSSSALSPRNSSYKFLASVIYSIHFDTMYNESTERTFILFIFYANCEIQDIFFLHRCIVSFIIAEYSFPFKSILSDIIILIIIVINFEYIHNLLIAFFKSLFNRTWFTLSICRLNFSGIV